MTAVSADEPGHKPLAQCKMAPIVLTLYAGTEDYEYRRAHTCTSTQVRCEPNGVAALRQRQIERLAHEALDQGALLTAEDFAFRIFNCGLRTISRDLKAPARQDIVVPLRSQQKDAGRALNRKPTYATRQVPVVVTLANQDDIACLRQGREATEILKRALVRAAYDAYAQGGVLTTADLAVLFHRGHSRIAELIRCYELETGEIVPRRGNVHDRGRTTTHKRIICHKAFVEGKPAHVIAQETCHSPEAVDHYLLDFARVHFATVQRGMSVEETVFATQRPRYLVEEYVKLIAEFELGDRRVHDRLGIQLELCDDQVQPLWTGEPIENERREQIQSPAD